MQRLPPGVPAQEIPSLTGFRRGKGGRRSRWALKADFLRAIQQQFGEREETAHALKYLRLCGVARPGAAKGQDGQERKVTGRRRVKAGKDASGHVGGLWKCSKRFCPVCGLRLAVRRFLQLQRRAVTVEAQHPGLLHVTGALTCRHHRGNNPREKFDALSALWNEFRKQPWVRGDNRVRSYQRKVWMGYFMCPEVTYSLTFGFHPHLQFGGSLLPPPELATPAERGCWFEAYRDQCRQWFEQNAWRYGISCEWKEDWLQVAHGALETVIVYICKGEKEHEELALETLQAVRAGSQLEDLDRLLQEGVMGAMKRARGLTESEMPVGERVNLWNATRGLRWFRVGGIWKDADTAKSDEETMAEDEEADEEISEMSVAAWNQLAREVRHILAALVEDIRFPRSTTVQAWVAAEMLAIQGCDWRTIRDTVLSLIPKEPPQRDHQAA